MIKVQFTHCSKNIGYDRCIPKKKEVKRVIYLHNKKDSIVEIVYFSYLLFKIICEYRVIKSGFEN